ncbi:hypothetical protein [Bacillus sp. M6-12]|nr:hypothetical protein [Bacillus sp. M6-12]
MRKTPKCKVISVQYVHYPEAAKKWFDLYADILLKEAENRQSNHLEVLNE